MLTHGHEDHVGALPYLLREVGGARGLGDAADARPGQVEARRARPAARGGADRGRARGRPRRASARSGSSSSAMAHSIPDAVGVVLETPGRPRSCHTGDYKIDHTPVDGIQHRRRPARRARQPRASTCCSATRRTPSGRASRESERVVGEAFRQIIPQRDGPRPDRLVRLEHPPHAAGDRRRGRGGPARSCVVGRSMRKNINIARNLGYVERARRGRSSGRPTSTSTAPTRC